MIPNEGEVHQIKKQMVQNMKMALRAGFEPARETPIGFQVQRLNHSAIAAALTTQTSLHITEHWEQKVAAYTRRSFHKRLLDDA